VADFTDDVLDVIRQVRQERNPVEAHCGPFVDIASNMLATSSRVDVELRWVGGDEWGSSRISRRRRDGSKPLCRLQTGGVVLWCSPETQHCLKNRSGHSDVAVERDVVDWMEKGAAYAENMRPVWFKEGDAVRVSTDIPVTDLDDFDF